MRSPSPETSFVALARVTKPVGLNGGVRVQLLCEGPERLMEVRQLFRGKDPGTTLPVAIRDISSRTNGVVVFFADCRTREAAEDLRDEYIFIDEGESIPAESGLPRVHELLDSTVRTRDGRVLGTVGAVYDLPSYRMIGVQVDGKRSEILVPWVDAWVEYADPEKKEVILVSDELFTDV